MSAFKPFDPRPITDKVRFQFAELKELGVGTFECPDNPDPALVAFLASIIPASCILAGEPRPVTPKTLDLGEQA